MPVVADPLMPKNRARNMFKREPLLDSIRVRVWGEGGGSHALIKYKAPQQSRISSNTQEN